MHCYTNGSAQMTPTWPPLAARARVGVVWTTESNEQVLMEVALVALPSSLNQSGYCAAKRPTSPAAERVVVYAVETMIIARCRVPIMVRSDCEWVVDFIDG